MFNFIILFLYVPFSTIYLKSVRCMNRKLYILSLNSFIQICQVNTFTLIVIYLINSGSPPGKDICALSLSGSAYAVELTLCQKFICPDRIAL